jgi:hypothetical protein
VPHFPSLGLSQPSDASHPATDDSAQGENNDNKSEEQVEQPKPEWHPPVDEERRPPHDNLPEYWEWETKSQFDPVAQDVVGKSVSNLCASFPKHLQQRIQPVLKMGHGEAKDKIESQLSTVSACLDDLVIFSDLAETINGFKVYDLLGTLPSIYHVDNPDFEEYFKQKELSEKGQLEGVRIDGWKLDKFKFLTEVEEIWRMRPGKDWYVFYETDTYIVWDNMFRLLENLDPEKQWYMGSPSPGRGGTCFANGGPGFVLSRAAIEKFLNTTIPPESEKDDPNGPPSTRWLELVKSDCCGDSVLGWSLHNAGVDINGFWPLFNAHAFHGVPYAEKQWCQPVITLHKTHPSDMTELWRWEHSTRAIDVSARLMQHCNYYYYQPCLKLGSHML